MSRFTPGELAVMRILWEHGELKPAEIQLHFPRPIKNPALRSYLTILVDKGHVARRRRGKAYVYKAKTRRDPSFRRMVGELVNSYCDGSVSALVCRLLESEKLSAEELEAIRRLVDDESS